jgi:hypothetical protein
MKKDKAKVLDEVLSEERIEEFLSLEPPANENADFHRLQKAYRGMPPQYFEIFLELFKSNGGDINAHSQQGNTLIECIQSHKQAQAYVELLEAANT